MRNSCTTCNLMSSAVKSLNSKELEELGNNCVEIEFNKGDIIFKQGALSSNIVYLKSGLAKIHIKGPYKEQIISITKATSYLGIPSTFNDKIDEYSATALEKTKVCFIDARVFKDFINRKGGFAYEIIIEMCKNKINAYKKCVNRAQKQVHGRIADSLLYFYKEIYNNKKFTLPLTRHEFAGLVDTSRESVCRILSQFNTDGIIKLNGNKITIVNEELLEKISKSG